MWPEDLDCTDPSLGKLENLNNYLYAIFILDD